MRTLAIVLGRNRDTVAPRLQSICAEMGSDYVEIEAIDGRTIDYEAIAPNIRDRNYEVWPVQRPGAVGCLLSHELAVRMALDLDEWPVLIVEEDVVPSVLDLRYEVEAALVRSESWGAEMTMLGAAPASKRLIRWVAPNLALATGHVWLMHAYALWRPGAEALAESLARRDRLSDQATWRVFERGRSLIRLPQLFVQRRDLDSNINGRRAGENPDAMRHDPSCGRPWLTEEFGHSAWRQA